MATYRWIDYDVWGNARDGFEVNQAFRTRFTVDVPEDAPDGEILKRMRAAGVFNSKATVKSVEIDGDPEFSLYFNQRKDGRPLGELQREDD